MPLSLATAQASSGYSKKVQKPGKEEKMRKPSKGEKMRKPSKKTGTKGNGSKGSKAR